MPLLSKTASAFTVYPISEKAVTLEFGTGINEKAMHLVNAFNELVCRQPFPGLLTTVPAYTTLSIFFDPLQAAKTNMPGRNCLEKVSNYLQQLQKITTKNKSSVHHTITIPVCYGGKFGPDMEEVAQLNNLTPDEVTRLHGSVTYLVHMIGFVPGFAYLGGMNPTIAAPRKATPRAAIPAGSVGIAGEQTGVYPLQTPGGWQLIGRTPVKLFNVNLPQPSLLKAGDKVIFKSMTPEEFEHYENQ
jgi:inhibitor of KinA